MIALRLAAFCFVLYGMASLCLAEWHYARGMATHSAQDSLDHLTRAGEVYPASFVFRTAQANQLFALARKLDGVADVAAESLSRALAIDPSSAELMSKLLLAQRAAGHCEAAKITGERLLRLAPRSEKAKTIVALPCQG